MSAANLLRKCLGIAESGVDPCDTEVQGFLAACRRFLRALSQSHTEATEIAQEVGLMSVDLFQFKGETTREDGQSELNYRVLALNCLGNAIYQLGFPGVGLSPARSLRQFCRWWRDLELQTSC